MLYVHLRAEELRDMTVRVHDPTAARAGPSNSYKATTFFVLEVPTMKQTRPKRVTTHLHYQT